MGTRNERNFLKEKVSYVFFSHSRTDEQICHTTGETTE
ncbi:Uncharacterized protein dnm_054600 [Desulfonema magnum]|uniref:Uncharacterized protein n=1 Tax=Desulfonema magnum TaxID=45655 RepID=A0A975BPN4_9BACT|nr:Uncharacterized protein dnm_054600 [Desulfonema magnum]